MLRSHSLITLFSLLTLALAACGGSIGSGPSTPGTPLPLSATVEGYNGGEGTVTAKMQTSLANVASGTISAEGAFTLELPGSLVPNQLVASAESFPCSTDTLTYSAPDAAADFLTNPEVIQGSEAVGTLSLSNRASDAAGLELGSKEVFPVYSSGALTVSGICTDAELGNVTTYDVTLEPGWNYVLQELTDNLGTAATYSVVAEVPADVTWRFVSTVVSP